MSLLSKFHGSVYYLFFNQYGYTFNPLDNTTYYFGAVASTTQADVNRIYIPRSCVVQRAIISVIVGGTLGGNSTSSIYLRVNNTTDYLISSSIVADASMNTTTVENLSISLAAGDYFEIKWTTPSWSPNPTTVMLTGQLHILDN